MKRSTFLALLTAPFILKRLPTSNQVSDIAKFYNVPPAKLADHSAVTFTNMSAANEAFVERMKSYQKIWFNCDFNLEGEDLYILPKK